MKKLYLVNAKLYIPLGDFENVKYIIYLLLLLFFVNKNGKYTIRLVSFLSKLFSCPLKFIWAQISNWFRKNPNKKKKKSSGPYLSKHKSQNNFLVNS